MVTAQGGQQPSAASRAPPLPPGLVVSEPRGAGGPEFRRRYRVRVALQREQGHATLIGGARASNGGVDATHGDVPVL